MVKHRQLARQVGTFGGFAIESSMDLDNMIFLTGSNFTFGSWICEADNQGKLQGCLLEDRKDQEDLILSARSTEELAKRFSRLAMSESVQVSSTIEFNSDSETESTSETNPGFFHDKPGSFPMGLRNSASIHQEINSSLLQNPSMKLGPFPIDLNMARSYQDLLQEIAGPVRGLRLTGAQEGLILAMTSQDYLVHWLGSISRSNHARLVDETAVLPYQEGSTLYDTDTSIEIISNSNGAVTVQKQCTSEKYS
jgi:hypothetical protein